MRKILVEDIEKNIKEMCVEVNYNLSPDMKLALEDAKKKEISPLGVKILEQLEENLLISKKDLIPICQDTGMAVVFIKVGQEVSFIGGSLEKSIHEGVRKGYKEGFDIGIKQCIKILDRNCHSKEINNDETVQNQ